MGKSNNKPRSNNNGKGKGGYNRSNRGKPNTKGHNNRCPEEEGSVKGSDYKLRVPVNPRVNDWTWYAANEQLLKDAASFSFNTALGVPLDMSSGLSRNVEPFYSSPHSVPGIMAISVLPTIGKALSGADAVNIAANNVYAWIRHANSGSRNYEAPDLMMYLLAMDSIYALLSHLKRAYGVLNLYSQTNRFVPEALFTSMGLDFDDFLKNIASFRYFLNSSIIRAAKLAVPTSMSIFDRHSWEFTGVYMDTDVTKSQLYLYTPEAFWKFSETALETGSSLHAVHWPKPNETLMTFAQLVPYVNQFLAAVNNSEDCGIIAGDILKAYGDGGVRKLAMVPEDYVCTPVYSESVLHQIYNVTCVGTFPGDRPNDVIHQDAEGTILFDPTFQTRTNVFTMKRPLNFKFDNPTPADVMDASRLTVCCNPAFVETEEEEAYPSDVYATLNSFACDVATVASTMIYTAAQGYHVYDQISSNVHMNDAFDLVRMAYNASFDWMFPIYITNEVITPESVNTKYHNVFYDFANYRLMDPSDLDKLHTTAILSLFDVPQMGFAKG